MPTKCPMCGAPMKKNICEYCGYEEIQDSNSSTSQASQPPLQPQVIITQQIVSPPEATSTVSKKSKSVALLLCIFLGILGAHRFYVGKVGSGFLYLVTGGLCGFGWIIDFFMIIFGTFKDQFGLPLHN